MAHDDTDLVARLFAREVPEIRSGSVEIKAIARKPGYRTKLAMQSTDASIDCVGVCVGHRGARIKEIVNALGGERIDIIRWNDSPEQLIDHALSPAVIEKIILHPAQRRAVVVVKADQTALVLGPGGENRELASELSGWQIEIEET
jgi:N utilization substance protein A